MAEIENNWLSEKGRDQIEGFVSEADQYLVERKLVLKLMLSLFEYNFEAREDLEILDFGSGNGALSKYFAAHYPENRYTLLDGSEVMLAKARKELNDPHFTFENQTFEEFIKTSLDSFKYHLILSAQAIHHLPFMEKTALFAKFYHELKFGGLFLNYDVVAPETSLCEDWQFLMWRDWMNANLRASGLENQVGKHDGLPQVYKDKAENKPSGLFEQLDALKKAGFRDVDCYYKNGIFALYGGRKS